MLGDLARSGFDVVDDHEEADAVVVNTCAFVEEAKAESLEVSQNLLSKKRSCIAPSTEMYTFSMSGTQIPKCLTLIDPRLLHAW